MPIIIHANIQTVAFRGIDTIAVDVQVHIANGLPAMPIAGLADKPDAESKERVRAALTSFERENRCWLDDCRSGQ